MPVLTWISGTFLMLHLAHSNVILTANLGDFNGMMSVAKQVAQAPVFAKIWQKASRQIKNQYYKELAKIRSEKQRHPKHNFEMEYEEKLSHRFQPNRQFKQRKAKRSSHGRIKDNRRQRGVNERPGQDDLEQRPSNGNADKTTRQGDVNESNDNKRPSQGNVDERPSKSNDEKTPSQGDVNERQNKGNVDKIPSQGNVDERQSLEVSLSQENVEDDVAALGKNASSYLKSINKIFENL